MCGQELTAEFDDAPGRMEANRVDDLSSTWRWLVQLAPG
jgi:hypothetical protein